MKKGEDMSRTPILAGKHAVVFGAGGSLGSAVANEFALEGAEVFLSGRTQSNVAGVADHITATGGRAHATVLDALDDVAVNDYLSDIAKQTGSVDIVYNATGPLPHEYANGKPAAQLSVSEFMLPSTTVLKSNFITARAAACQMMNQRSGVILLVTGSPARGHVPGATAIGAAFGAIENLTENLAIEVGPFGVRVVCLRTLANTDSRSIQQTMDLLVGALNITKDQAIAQIEDSNFLKRTAGVVDTAKAAVFLVSDSARMMTGTVTNATAGAALD
jgi:NAD(P)-dependent dehydrogenase (short-subunit alcohol dehydrogenase family)